jgi:hypothetical protein
MRAFVLALTMLLAVSPLAVAKKTKTPKSSHAKGYKSHHSSHSTKASKLKKQNQSKPKRVN